MLASTVQFSTNDQPTTRTAHTKPPTQPAKPTTSKRYVNQIAPGTETTTHPHHSEGAGEPARLFFQDPTGCLSSSTSRTSHRFPPPSQVRTQVAGRCRWLTRQCLRHMSTPPPQTGSAGHWTAFAV